MTTLIRNFFALVVCLVLMVDGAFACSCWQVPPIPKEFEQSDAVFAGQVVELRKIKSKYHNGFDWLEAKFKVERTWKLVETEDVVVRTTFPSSATCDYPFKIGDRTLVYAYLSKDDGILHTGSCSQTENFPEAEKHLGIIGEGRKIQPKPTPQVSASVTTTVSYTAKPILLGSLALVLFVVILVTLRFAR